MIIMCDARTLDGYVRPLECTTIGSRATSLATSYHDEMYETEEMRRDLEELVQNWHQFLIGPVMYSGSSMTGA